jgi:hypothetical protein
MSNSTLEAQALELGILWGDTSSSIYCESERFKHFVEHGPDNLAFHSCISRFSPVSSFGLVTPFLLSHLSASATIMLSRLIKKWKGYGRLLGLYLRSCFYSYVAPQRLM